MIKEDKSESIWSSAFAAILTTFFARGIGFIRELIAASIFGTSAIGDAFIVSMTIPEVLISGFSFAVSSLYIPTVHKIRQETHLEKNIADFNSSIMLFLILLSSMVVALVEMFPKNVVELFAAGFDPETMSLTIKLTRIISVSIIPICLGSFFKAYGQMINRYSIMTGLGVFINFSIIIGLYFSKGEQIAILGLSVLIGNAVYAIVCSCYCFNNGLKLSAHGSLYNKYLQEMIVSVVPVFISEIISEINQLVDKNFASRLSPGTISALNYSSKIINLITAIIGTAIASVFFSKLSEKFAKKKFKELANYITKINEIMLTMLLPIMISVAFFPDILIEVLFGRGQFSNQSIFITSECLKYYSIGIIGFNIKAIWIRIYNAALETKALAINSAVAVILNISMNVVLIRNFKHIGLASATCVASLITDLLLILKYQKINPSFSAKTLFVSVTRVFACSSIYIVIYILGSQLLTADLVINIVTILFLFVVASIFYMLLLIVAKTEVGIEVSKFNKRRKIK